MSSNVYNRPMCGARHQAGIRSWVTEEAADLGVKVDREFIERCVREGALAATDRVRRRYLHQQRTLSLRVQEAVADSAGPPENLEDFLARVSPGALRRLNSRRA